MFRNSFILVFISVLLLSPPAWAQDTLLNQLITEKINSGRVEGEELKTRPLLKIFYEDRDYELLWSKKDKLKKQAKKFITFINE